MDNLNKKLKKESGNFASNDRLTYFLYLLMRDKLSAGDVEHLFRKVENECGGEIVEYSNGFIAQYAAYLSREIQDK